MLCAQIDYQEDEYGPYGKEGKSMGKFKVGDRVRVLRNYKDMAAEKGATATVTGYSRGYDGDTTWMQVKWDRNGKDCGQMNGGYEEWKFRLAAVADSSNAPLTLREGGYYRTRNGRKIGPMRGPEYSCYWRKDVLWNDGESHDWDGRIFNDGTINDYDIIAEWTDEEEHHDDALSAALGLGVPELGAGKPKFKVGDRVYAEYSEISGSGSIIEVDADDDNMTYRVHFDSGERLWVYSYTVRQLQIAAIVCRIDSGQPLPATRPYVHADREAATAEASRLATLNPGKEFGVYELVAKKVADVTVRDAA